MKVLYQRVEKNERLGHYSISLSLSYLTVEIDAIVFSAEPSPMPIEDDESPIDDLERRSEASTNSSGDHAAQTPRPDSRTKKIEKKKDVDHQRLSPDLTRPLSEHLTGKGSSTHDSLTQKSLERKPYNHDILVIQTQPPKVN